MNALVLAITGIVTAGGAVGYAFLGPLGESGTDCDSKPLEAEDSSEYVLRLKLTNIDGEPNVRVCIFTHDKVQKVFDAVVSVPAGATRGLDVEMPSRVFFLNAYHIRYELAHGGAESAGVDDCSSRLIEVEFTYGADLIRGSSGECAGRDASGGLASSALPDRRRTEA